MSVEILSNVAQLYGKIIFAVGIDLEGDSRLSELPPFDKPYITSD